MLTKLFEENHIHKKEIQSSLFILLRQVLRKGGSQMYKSVNSEQSDHGNIRSTVMETHRIPRKNGKLCMSCCLVVVQEL